MAILPKVLTGIMVAAVSSGVFFALTDYTPPSTGARVGQIAWVVKSNGVWTARLVGPGLSSDGGVFSGSPFVFTIPDDRMAGEIQKYLSKQTSVVVRYHTVGLSWRLSSPTGIYVDSVEPLSN